MGIFSGKTKTQVATQFQRVLEDNTVPNSVSTGVTKNLFDADSGGDQMVEYILEELASSVGLKANRMYEYGKDGYIFGLPQSSYHSSLAGKDASKAAITAMVGGQVELSYYHFGAMNLVHAAWQVLVDSYQYNAATNTLVVTGKTVYLKDIQAVVVDASTVELDNGSLEVWGIGANAGKRPDNVGDLGSVTKPTPYMVNPGATADCARVDYCWEETYTTLVEGINVTKTRLVTDSFTVPFTGLDMEADYHQARYITGTGAVGYWSYKQDSGTQPAIDAVFNTVYNGSGSFFPIGYFRFDKKSTVDNKNSAEYVSAKKLFHYLNMDYETIGKGINENPDIKDVEQAMVMMVVPANTTNDLEQRYLFDFFSNVQKNTASWDNNSTDVEFMSMKFKLNMGNNDTSIIIQDKRFKMALAFKNIIKKKLSGVLGPIGTHQSGTSNNQHWYRRQITDVVYEEVQVTGLSMTYWIWENYTTVGDGTDEILMIPIDVAILKGYSLPDREVLYARALHYCFNSRVVTKLKWYQTGIFKGIMVLAAIVITVISYGSTWQAIAAAVAAGASAAAIATMIAISVVKYLLVQLAIKLFVAVVGVKIAFIAAIIAAIAGSYQAIKAGSLAGAPWAKELLSVSTGLSAGVQGQLQSDFQDLLAEQSEFDKVMAEQTKTLEAAENLLNGNNRLNPLIIFGESPNEFYQRTVHSGNIGIVGIDAVSAYVDVALRLPKLSDTIGDVSYG